MAELIWTVTLYVSLERLHNRSGTYFVFILFLALTYLIVPIAKIWNELELNLRCSGCVS